ncbi:MAG: PASTA domain-containing protein [Deltaproteobacteria bacterium]|nr:PASTA domain-containing protein [Deltaproteobacteria bacterium]
MLFVGAIAYITLTVIIKSKKIVVVPDLAKKSVVYSLEILTDLGLNAKIKGFEYSDTVPLNTVIHQEPDPGTEIKFGRDVRLIISKGAKTIITPDLKELSVQQARITLEENGLLQGKISKTYSNNIKKGEIIAQFTSPDTLVKQGSTVDLLVSMGARPTSYKMIDLKGLFLEDAILLIERNNLLLGEIKYSSHKDKPEKVVVMQEPLSGQRILKKTYVNIEINRKTDNKNHQYLFDVKPVSLFRYRLKNGFLKKHILARLISSGFSTDLFDNYVKPGEEVWLFIPENNDSTFLLYENDELIKAENFN